jgi:hypothetical protein
MDYEKQTETSQVMVQPATIRVFIERIELQFSDSYVEKAKRLGKG